MIIFRCWTLAGLAVLIGHGYSFGATITPIATPGAPTVCCGSYTESTNVFALPTTDGDLFTTLTNGSEVLTFSTEFMRLMVPVSWASWSSPPQSETATPAVAWSNWQVGVTLTLRAPAAIFGFELEPDDTSSTLHAYTVAFLHGSTPLGSIVFPVSGDAGALLFAGEVVGSSNPNLIDTVTIAGNNDFALANIRYGDVPEPASLLLTIVGGLMIVWRRISTNRSGCRR